MEIFHAGEYFIFNGIVLIHYVSICVLLLRCFPDFSNDYCWGKGDHSQLAFAFSKLTMKIPEQYAKYILSE